MVFYHLAIDVLVTYDLANHDLANHILAIFILACRFLTTFSFLVFS